MKAIFGLSLITFGALTVVAISPADSAPLCPGLTGSARKACLEAEKQRIGEIARRDSRRAAILEATHKSACKAERYGKETVVGVGGATHGVPGAVLGSGAYEGGGAVGTKIAGKSGCP